MPAAALMLTAWDALPALDWLDMRRFNLLYPAAVLAERAGRWKTCFNSSYRTDPGVFAGLKPAGRSPGPFHPAIRSSGLRQVAEPPGSYEAKGPGG